MIDINTLTEDEIDNLREQIRKRDNTEQYNRNIDSIIENRKYIGKCFYNEKTHEYIKVLSSKSSNEFRLECMTFSYPIKCQETMKWHKFTSPDDCFSRIESEFLVIKDYPLLCNGIAIGTDYDGKVIDNLKLISNLEFEKALRGYIENLICAMNDGEFDTSKNVRKRE